MLVLPRQHYCFLEKLGRASPTATYGISEVERSQFTVGAQKCTLAKTSMTFLGHLVSKEGLRPDPRLLESIREIQPHLSVTQARSFLGLVGYYQKVYKGVL